MNPMRNPLQWVMYDCQADTCDKNMLGKNDGNDVKSGMLGNVEPTFNGAIPYYYNPKNLSQFVLKTQPFFLDNSS